MRIIIAGSRNITDKKLVESVIENCLYPIDQIVCGGAKGVDLLGKEWAESQGIDVALFLPDWNKYGKGAGMVRNMEMGNYADALITIWDGKSRGTKHMIDYMRRLGKAVLVHAPYEEIRKK